MSALARECEKVSSDRHVRARTDRPMYGDRGTIISTVSWCLLGALSRGHSGPQRLIRDPRRARGQGLALGAPPLYCIDLLYSCYIL